MTRGKLHRLVALKFARKNTERSAKYRKRMHAKWLVLPDNYSEKRASYDTQYE